MHLFWQVVAAEVQIRHLPLLVAPVAGLAVERQLAGHKAVVAVHHLLAAPLLHITAQLRVVL
jgi:hypothetical protein